MDHVRVHTLSTLPSDITSSSRSDPIDGTTNYVHGLTDVVISIALAVDKELVLGVIYNPFLDEMVRCSANANIKY